MEKNEKLGRLKDRLRKNLVTVGSWITLGQPAIAEIMAGGGFDWLTVDMEHTTIGMHEAGELIRTIDLLGIPALVRLTSSEPGQIKRVLDGGASGIIVPMVNSPEEAERIVKAVRYPPAGERGVGLARAQGYGFTFEEYLKVQEESVIIVQIEHYKAVERLEEILSVNGIDGSIIGPYDLSGSLGVPGQFEDARVNNFIRQYKEISRKLKKPTGYHVIHPDYRQVIEKIHEGFTFIAFSVDFLFLGTSCREQMNKVRNQ